MKQKIKTILIPEAGLDLSPPSVVKASVETDFIRAFAHMVGKGNQGGVLIRSTSDGRLHVAQAGTSMETYVVEGGTAANAFTGGNTYDQVNAFYATDLLIETHPAIVAFRDQAGVYGNEKIIPVGMHSIDLIHYGMRIRNRNAGFNAVYEFTIYR